MTLSHPSFLFLSGLRFIVLSFPQLSLSSKGVNDTRICDGSLRLPVLAHHRHDAPVSFLRLQPTSSSFPFLAYTTTVSPTLIP